jgi:ferritin-like protein
MTDKPLHEKALSARTLDQHRAISSLMEELEAVDWYAQRIEAATDPELRAILEHNRDEEKEHAAMVLEWLRRTDPVFDEYLREYLFSEGPIRESKARAGSEVAQGEARATRSLGIGSLKEPRNG